MSSIFDFSSISETVYKGTIPNPDWVLVPEGEYLMQCTKIEGREVEGRRVEGTFLFAELSWEVLDDSVKTATNMEHPTVRQSFSLTMNGSNQLDLSANQNMSLKAIWKACGLLRDPSINKIKGQTAWGRVEHTAMKDTNGAQRLDAEGRAIYTAQVTRVTSLEAAQAAQRRAA